MNDELRLIGIGLVRVLPYQEQQLTRLDLKVNASADRFKVDTDYWTLSAQRHQ